MFSNKQSQANTQAQEHRHKHDKQSLAKEIGATSEVSFWLDELETTAFLREWGEISMKQANSILFLKDEASFFEVKGRRSFIGKVV